MATLPDGIELSKINPKYLHSNSTSHVWAFGAFAELIDNAYDPDVDATTLEIDIQTVGNKLCLTLLDDGAGMDKKKITKMLSFGYCDKDTYNNGESYKPVGLYGNGFKSGSMRLGKDALVFSRCSQSACIGLLSQTYLEAIGADSVIVPILEYSLPDLNRNNDRQCLNNLEAILQYSVFESEALLKGQLNALKSSVTGTKIFIFNLHRLQSGKVELDFQSDRKDIRCPDPYMEDTTNLDCRPVEDAPEYKRSLREYCSILYMRPKMKIILRGHTVKSKYISKMLHQTENHQYKPSWMGRNEKPIKIKIGFSCATDCNENYGLMLYHKNRLMRAYERVGYQKQANERGVGVIGVVELDFITPTHNKQDFYRNDHFNSIMSALANKINAYWNSKKEIQNNDIGHSKLPDWTWAQCDKCNMWRRMPEGTDGDSLPRQWFCYMNKDAQYNRCYEDEEPEAPVDTPRRKANNKRNTEPLSQSTQAGESSTATEPIPKRNKIAVKSPAPGSKSQTRSKSPKAKSPKAKSPKAKSPKAKSPKAKSPKAKSPKAKSPKAKSPKAKSPKAKSPALKVLNKRKTQSKKNPWTSSSQNNNTNSVGLDNSDDNSDGFEGTSSGSCRRPVKNRKTTGSSPLLRVSRSLFNVNKSSDRIHNNNNDDQVSNHSSMEQEGGQVLIRSMRYGVHVAIQTEPPESDTENDVVTRTSSTFHRNVIKLIEKILPEMDIGDVCDIESMVSNMIREDTPEDSEDEIPENFLHL